MQRYYRRARARIHFAAALAAGLVLAAPPAQAIEVQCGAEGGDAFGWAVASGGDFDGDGNPDIAISAPCSWVGGAIRAGRVKVVSGDDGSVLLSLRGSDPEQQLGAAVAFIPDLDGDGRADLVIGSPNTSAPKPGGGVFLFAGKVEAFSSQAPHDVIWTARGASANATFGESVDVIPDVSGDGKAEVVAGASGASVGGLLRGSGYLLSGANGAQLARKDGEQEGELWGSLVGHAGDVDGDGSDDWLAATRIAGLAPEGELLGGETTTTSTTTTTIPPRAGRLSVYSGVPPYEEIQSFHGDELVDRLGRSAAAAGDMNDDDLGDLWIGSPGAEPNELEDAGSVSLWSGSGEELLEILEPTPQQLAAFGTSVLVPGSLDEGTQDDVVAGAPNGRVSGRNQAGRVHAWSPEQDDFLWTASGSLALERFGQSLASGLDHNGDGVPDVIVGAPGNSPAGKRGAGSAFILSGASGQRLAAFHGRRGRETRIFAAGPSLAREPMVRALDPEGRRREAVLYPFRGGPASRLSLAILNGGRREETQNGAKTLLAIGTGTAGNEPGVEVYRANRRKRRVSSFTAGPAGYEGGLNVAAGDFSSQITGDELLVVPGTTSATNVDAFVYQAQFVDPITGAVDWTVVRQFTAYQPGDKLGLASINANGAYAAGGDLTVNEGDEIVVTPAAGLPVVRLFGRNGSQTPLVKEWQAYPFPGSGTQPNSGVTVAVGNLDGDGRPEIVTAPAKGQPWVRAWRPDGTAFEHASGQPVSFVLQDFGVAFGGGLTVATADVDFDGDAEIIVAPGEGVPARILAFEMDGTPVAGWIALEPFGPLARNGLGLVGLDEFWRP
jgi:hypothetical protein